MAPSFYLLMPFGEPARTARRTLTFAECYAIAPAESAISTPALSARLISRHDPPALSKRECTPPIRELEVS